EVNSLIQKVNNFGFHFASLDIRQNSKIHDKVVQNVVKHLVENNENQFPSNYFELNESEKFQVLNNVNFDLQPNEFKDEVTISTLESIRTIKTIQENNGELGANRYIISNNESALNVMEVYALFQLSGWQ